MMLRMDSLDGSVPKRGDVVQTNVGDKRERTWLILRVRRGRIHRRFNVWAERWWQIEPDLRMRLYRSAQRAGGQRIIYFERYKAKPARRPAVDLFP